MPKTDLSSGSKTSKIWTVPPAISYKLSEQAFIDKGWTFLADITPVVPVVTMKAKFSHPEISPWFKIRDDKLIKNYPNGKVLCEANEDATGKIYYPNGKVAIEIKKVGRNKQKTQIWIMSPGGIDDDGVRRPAKLCALFDSLGNGVVYNHCGEKRMVYDQNRGVLWDAPNGVPVYWKWHNVAYSGSLTSLKSVVDGKSVSETQSEVKDKVSEVEEKKGKKVEEKTGMAKAASKSSTKISTASTIQTTQTSTTYQESHSQLSDSKYLNASKLRPPQGNYFKPMTIRINKYISLWIFDQADVCLKFFAQAQQIRLDIGILYNPENKFDVKKIERNFNTTDKVLCTYEVLPATTESMQKLKKVISMIKKPQCKKNKK